MNHPQNAGFAHTGDGRIPSVSGIICMSIIRRTGCITQGTSGCSSVIVGGSWNNSSNAGVSALNVNNGVSNSNANIGSRLLYFYIHSDRDHASWHKTTNKNSLGFVPFKGSIRGDKVGRVSS